MGLTNAFLATSICVGNVWDDRDIMLNRVNRHPFSCSNLGEDMYIFIRMIAIY